MLTKKLLKQAIEEFPEMFSLDELIEKLIIIEKIQEGEKQSQNNEVLSESELDNEVKKWFK